MEERLRVLSFSTVYPRPREPNHGIFVERRLKALAALADVVVMAPVPWVEPGNPGHRFPGFGLKQDEAGGLEVLRPRWLYAPGLHWLTAVALAARCAPAVLRLARRFPFDVIDAHFGYPAGVAAAMVAGVTGRPFTVTLRGNETMHAGSGAVRRMMAWCLRRAAAVIGVSKPLAAFAVEMGADPKRCHVIPNGIDTGLFHPVDRAGARTRLGMRDDRRQILSSGYLIERKGHHRILEALPRLHARGIPAELWIVGGRGREGDFAATIEATIERLKLRDWVRMIAPVPPAELASMMTAADVFCLASNREGWPNVVNEALACATPVVTTNVGGAPDMVPGDDYGYVVPPGDGEALEAALARALTKEWDRGAIAAWGGSRSWQRVAAETLEVLRAATRATIGDL
jgi:glycosyltransferase involved in cell wall biosynthesis